MAGAPRSNLTEYLQTKQLQPEDMTALSEIIRDLEGDVQAYGDYKSVPPNLQTNVRNDMYVTSEALRLMLKADNPKFNPDEKAALNNYKSKVDKATKFIPAWVKVAVALALGLGTMVSWKRIVVTVGEKSAKNTSPTPRAPAQSWSPWPPSPLPITSDCPSPPPTCSARALPELWRPTRGVCR